MNEMLDRSGAAPILSDHTAQRLLAAARTGLLVVDGTGIRYANPAAMALFGHELTGLIGRRFTELIAPEDRPRVAEQLQRRLAGEAGRPYEVRCLRRDGSVFDGRVCGQLLCLEGKNVNLVTLTDVTELKDALRRVKWSAGMLAESEALCGSGSFELHWPDGEIALSDGLRALVGLGPDDGRPGTLAQAPWIPAEERELVAGIWRHASPGEPFELVHSVTCSDGRRLMVLHRGLLTAPAEHHLAHRGIAILQDVTARREAEQRIQELANFDEITGLANRTHLLQQIETAIVASRWDGLAFSLMSIEVPRISRLVSTMGFGAGDTLAMSIAARLGSLCAEHEQVARLGGSEFALLIRHASEQDRACTLQRGLALQAALQQPVRLGDSEVFPLCRIGIARFPEDGRGATQVLEAAQTARLGAPPSDGICFFKPASNTQALRELQLDAALRQALSRGELSLAYQPQVCLGSGAVIGTEALLRWHSPELGVVSPVEFIPVAERTGLIATIGLWVMHEVCAQSVRWREAGLPPLRIGINISPVQFQLGDVAASLDQALQATGALPASIGVEITESALVQDSERVAATLRTLQQRGIEISLDDFGTGYSSLSLLRSLPIDVLKVDRAFVSDVTAAPESASVTRSIIHLAHGLQIRVLAEGVETEDQLNMLVASGCDQMQGYWFSRPLAADAMAELLRAGRQLPVHLTRRRDRSRTLLLVDDEPHMLAALQRLFRRERYHVLTARDGEQALRLLAASDIDVIISDQRMPGMSGIEFLRQARTLYPDTVRMILSGYTDLQSIIDAVNEGSVFRFLTKPWDDDRLREQVAQAFRHKEAIVDARTAGPRPSR
ncbi:PAS domain S-box-containing protein/diguanylate cyclase (GGDEF)-like protein [Sphaerotilus hippei]|uniref:PAS domain S-box-containing protein/diguanylate cyclase (GGDEF)-like protein n=1 Tax=Sphaerotilus hippei TaxID=744406 RepID=A0A318H049_9BURK|nr:EAL domain-containing protein [Sphaerotilus hippei]PXW96114.1 PAS domain S-box-containing protein/diguanylate cyclase (GGDEF)-like protein [Sphaerotilus hippei]